MREKLVINDVHLGVQRAAGTTPSSAAELRAYLQKSLRQMFHDNQDKDIIINGDLFDDFIVPMSDLLEFFRTACIWLDKSDESARLVLGAGNHDLSKDSSRLSSFETVGRILESQYPDQVHLVLEPTMLFDGVYMIPHLANQDLFNLALTKIPLAASVVLLHCNYDNGFAAQQDHSLNLSKDEAQKILHKVGGTIVIGHEHQGRVLLKSGVVVTGNQWPSSIRDCLGNDDDRKHAYYIAANGRLSKIQTWSAAHNYDEVTWDIGKIATKAKFIRVVGTAKAEQASDVIARVSKLRSQSDAFIVSNAVEIEGVQDISEVMSSVEATKQFDVLKFLLEQLEPEQATVVKRLMEERV